MSHVLRMRPWWRAALAAALIAAGCGKDAERTVGTNVRYTVLTPDFTSAEDCRAATAGSGFNCDMWLDLCSNGGFSLVVTDITNEGLYVLDGDTIHARTQGPGDGPSAFTATIASDQSLSSPELGNGWRVGMLDDQARSQLDDECMYLEGRTWWPR